MLCKICEFGRKKLEKVVTGNEINGKEFAI